MRLFIEKKETIENNEKLENITTKHEFLNVDINTSWTDWGASYIPKGCLNIKGACPNLINFAFNIIKNKNNNICLEVKGEVIKKMTTKGNYPIQKTTLELNKPVIFKTKQNGLEYSLTLLDDEEQNEKMPLKDLYMLFLRKGRLSSLEYSLYATTIYRTTNVSTTKLFTNDTTTNN